MKKQNVLITGGAGYLGSYLVQELLAESQIDERLVVYSRDELKHFRLKNVISDPKMKLVIGDVRDAERLTEAMRGIEVVVHAAALKHLDICEQNPEECIKSNVLGTENVIRAAKQAGVQHLIFISTDKAVEPVSVYGNSKQTAEKLILRANSDNLRTTVLRLGNLLGSIGSLVEKINGMAYGQSFPLFHCDLTRFADSRENTIRLLRLALTQDFAGCILLPKLRAFRVFDLLHFLRPDLKMEILSGRYFEKTAERMVSRNELDRVLETNECFLIPDSQYSLDEALDRFQALPARMSSYDSNSVESVLFVQFDHLRSIS